MTTALQIVNSAAEKIGVKTAEIPLEADDYRVIFEEMNDMLSEWADSNITPTFSDVTNSTDTVDVPRDAIGAVKSMLAVRVAPIFQKTISPGLATSASMAYNRLLASSVYIGPVAYPDTMPMGSGNECWEHDDRFFPENKVENF